MIRVALTGATGLLGRNLLFELLKRHLGCLDQLRVYVLGRSGPQAPLRDRLDAILVSDGAAYIGAAGEMELHRALRRCVVPVPFHLEGASANDDALALLAGAPMDLFIHCAALTDLRNDTDTSRRLQAVNVEGTRRVLALVNRCEVGQLALISSAYVCGAASGHVPADYVDPLARFRNEYERTKLQSEALTRAYCARHGLRLRVFRPSTICGRLIEPPLGSVSKFDVFLGWISFFVRQKWRILGTTEGLFTRSIAVPVRVHVNPDAGLNIVPVDYAAKLILEACLGDCPGDSFHVTAERDILHTNYFTWMYEAVRLTGINYVTSQPGDLSALERRYYASVGQVFGGYITGPSMQFSVEERRLAEARLGLTCPEITRERFMRLMDFAIDHAFGLDLTQR